MSLYPLKFKTIYKDKIWGGNKIKSILHKDYGDLPNCGEAWELSGVQDNVSVVANGFLEGNNIEELIEIYMGELVGDKVYEKFGNEFPLLIKFIDANDFLSIQVHPDDKVALKRHKAYGKTEMWYVIQADENAQLISGFNRKVSKSLYLQHLNNKTLAEILNVEKVIAGDVFFIPAGRVHAIGPGILLAEIQQTSDVTYRIYDYNRKDSEGNTRDLHTDLALDVVDYDYHKSYRTEYKTEKNKSSKIVECNYFKSNIIEFNNTVTKDYTLLDSFVVYICLEGSCSLIYNTSGDSVPIKQGETVLTPAAIETITLKPKEASKLIEVYV